MYFAEGGEPPVGKPSLVGEKGPELFVPHQAGTVIPYHKVKAAIEKKKGVSTAPYKNTTSGIARQLGAA
jgi:hypothetical protein